jgi:ubiquinone/menaquinone biosynthesis C-methylase UbiE
VSNWIQYFKNSNRTLFSESIRNRKLFEIVMKYTPLQGKILEAGCGTALLSIILSDSGYDVTAMDITEDIVQYAKNRCFLNNIKLNFITGDILEMSKNFKQQEFETICHSGVLEHFSDENIIKSLREHRIISRRVIFNVPNIRNKVSCESYGDERLMSNDKWLQLIQKAGYKSMKVYGGYDVPRPFYFMLPGVFFNNRLSFWWKWVSKHSIFYCE